MATQQEILDYLKKILQEEFEIEPEHVELDAQLSEDLDIDSLDAIDLIVHIREYTGQKVDPENFRDFRTVADIVTFVQKLKAK